MDILLDKQLEMFQCLYLFHAPRCIEYQFKAFSIQCFSKLLKISCSQCFSFEVDRPVSTKIVVLILLKDRNVGVHEYHMHC